MSGKTLRYQYESSVLRQRGAALLRHRAVGRRSRLFAPALRARLIGCRVVVPLYDGIPQELRDQMHFVTSISVPVAWRRQYCGIFEAKVNNVIYYLIDNQYYFKRSGIYGHFDDAERFAFFSGPFWRCCPISTLKPDIIHANDWQTALVPVYYRLFYANTSGTLV